MNERLRILQRQPHRISITISYQVYQSLLSRSEEEGRSMSNLCAYLLEESLQHTAAPSSQPHSGLPSSDQASFGAPIQQVPLFTQPATASRLGNSFSAGQ